MKHKRLVISLILLGCVFTIVYYGGYRYYAPPRLRTPYQLSNNNDDTIRIAYIGDSWAFMHKDHKCKISKLLCDTLHRPVKVHSYGICGLTSKEIYENIFDNNDFKHFLQKREYGFCFISAGINDTYKKMSTTYYQQSMDGIVRFLLANNIHPIILEIPDYNIQECFDRQKTSRRALRRLSMFVNNTPIDCKQQFRNVLDELINERKYNNQVGIVRYKSWNRNYENDQKNLYLDDGLHLNDKGYQTLDSVIVAQILRKCE